LDDIGVRLIVVLRGQLLSGTATLLDWRTQDDRLQRLLKLYILFMNSILRLLRLYILLINSILKLLRLRTL